MQIFETWRTFVWVAFGGKLLSSLSKFVALFIRSFEFGGARGFNSWFRCSQVRTLKKSMQSLFGFVCSTKFIKRWLSCRELRSRICSKCWTQNQQENVYRRLSTKCIYFAEIQNSMLEVTIYKLSTASEITNQSKVSKANMFYGAQHSAHVSRFSARYVVKHSAKLIFIT